MPHRFVSVWRVVAVWVARTTTVVCVCFCCVDDGRLWAVARLWAAKGARRCVVAAGQVLLLPPLSAIYADSLGLRRRDRCLERWVGSAART